MANNLFTQAYKKLKEGKSIRRFVGILILIMGIFAFSKLYAATGSRFTMVYTVTDTRTLGEDINFIKDEYKVNVTNEVALRTFPMSQGSFVMEDLEIDWSNCVGAINQSLINGDVTKNWLYRDSVSDKTVFTMVMNDPEGTLTKDTFNDDASNLHYEWLSENGKKFLRISWVNINSSDTDLFTLLEMRTVDFQTMDLSGIVIDTRYGLSAENTVDNVLFFYGVNNTATTKILQMESGTITEDAFFNKSVTITDQHSIGLAINGSLGKNGFVDIANITVANNLKTYRGRINGRLWWEQFQYTNKIQFSDMVECDNTMSLRLDYVLKLYSNDALGEFYNMDGAWTKHVHKISIPTVAWYLEAATLSYCTLDKDDSILRQIDIADEEAATYSVVESNKDYNKVTITESLFKTLEANDYVSISAYYSRTARETVGIFFGSIFSENGAWWKIPAFIVVVILIMTGTKWGKNQMRKFKKNR